MYDKRAIETLNSIEEAQHGLRRSISETRQLAAAADRLIKRYRGDVGEAGGPGNSPS
jgi:hypothetical protein